MARTNRGSNEHFRPRPVERIELEDKKNKKRLIIVIVLIAIALVSFGYGTFSYFDSGDGWNEVHVSASEKIAEHDEFTFMYELGLGEQSALAENKALAVIYTESMKQYTRSFQADVAYEDVHNVFYLNHHPNEIVEVSPVLYGAFEKLEKYQNRNLYLAPIYQEYNNMFYCNNDEEAEEYDPFANEEQKEYFEEVLTYCQDPDMIQIELLGKNQVKLAIADAYLAYHDEVAFDKWIDFAWMKNAFIVDGLADAMIEKGYTHGVISSYDGFVRNLDASGELYSYPIIDRVENTVFHAAFMNYSGNMAICWFRDFPTENKDIQHYYNYADGRIRSLYVDAKDGLGKSCAHSLYAYQQSGTCVDLMLKLAPFFISEQIDKQRLKELIGEEIGVIYGEDYTLRYTQQDVELVGLFEKDEIHYQKELVVLP